MTMKKMMSKKMVKIIAMVMVVAMLLSVCLLETFAAVRPGADVEPCASGTLQGYRVSATLSQGIYNSRFVVNTLSDVNMGVTVTGGYVTYYAAHPDGDYEYRDLNGTATYYGYELSIPVTIDGSIASNYETSYARADVQFGYNGQTHLLRPTM